MTTARDLPRDLRWMGFKICNRAATEIERLRELLVSCGDERDTLQARLDDLMEPRF